MHRIVAPALAALLLSAAPADASDRDLRAVEAWLATPGGSLEAPAMTRPLDRATAERVVERLAAARLAGIAAERREEIAAKQVRLGDKVMRYEVRTFGDAPAGRRSLWISMHGGGNAPPALNDRQWQNQIRLYEPAEGVYIAPRAPTDTWNLWHEPHVDPMFQRLIEEQVATNGVDPNRVYLMGYSAGGDGVWQLAPRMADRFAAAAMMAGHPNEATVIGLRNLPFAIFMGGNDSAYDRNRIAADRGAELDRLRAADPDGYAHMVRIYEGLGHWMERRDAEALPWMAGFVRDPWPRRIVWMQDDVTADRFYWLALPDGAEPKAGDRIVATADGQAIAIEGAVPAAGLTLRLSDRLLDLDGPVRVTLNGRVVHDGRVPRTAGAIQRSLLERADAPAAAMALLTVR